MSEAQWSALETALASVLSPSGLAKLNTIRSLEAEVAELEGGLFGFLMDRIRLPGRYFLALFGTPGPERPWGMRFDGHHLSLNWTATPGRPLSVTPLFLGGQPARRPGAPRTRGAPGARRGGGPRDRLRQRALACRTRRGPHPASARAPASDARCRSRARSPLELDAPAGLARRELGAASQARLDALFEVQLANFAPRRRGALHRAPIRRGRRLDPFRRRTCRRRPPRGGRSLLLPPPGRHVPDRVRQHVGRGRPQSTSSGATSAATSEPGTPPRDAISSASIWRRTRTRHGCTNRSWTERDPEPRFRLRPGPGSSSPISGAPSLRHGAFADGPSCALSISAAQAAAAALVREMTPARSAAPPAACSGVPPSRRSYSGWYWTAQNVPPAWVTETAWTAHHPVRGQHLGARRQRHDLVLVAGQGVEPGRLAGEERMAPRPPRSR